VISVLGIEILMNLGMKFLGVHCAYELVRRATRTSRHSSASIVGETAAIAAT
jgi:hypothetical protein